MKTLGSWLRAAFGALLMTLIAARVSAAELVRADGSRCDMKLKGSIVDGDANKLLNLGRNSRLCLHSPGGSFSEGVKIFDYIAGIGITTVVEPSDECFSSCAIAFMAGSLGAFGDRAPSRILYAGGQLGFHGPFYAGPGAKELTTQEQVGLGVTIGILTVAKLLRTDKHGLFPRTLMAEMLETPSRSLYKIDTFGAAHDAKIELAGVRNPERITKRMLYQACVYSDPWSTHVTNVEDAEVTSNQLTVREKGNVYRIVFQGFGFQSAEHCIVDVISSPGKPTDLRMQFALEKTARAGLLEHQKPLWHLYAKNEPIVNFAAR